MEITGRITQIGSIFKATSAKNGNDFVKRDIVISCNEDYYSRDGIHKEVKNELVFTLLYEMAENFSLEKGANVKLYYSSSVMDYNGRFYETKTVRNIHIVAQA